MKNRKAKGLLLGLAMVASIGTVGYASWVITSSPTADLDGGEITVETVTDNSIKLEATWLAESKGSPLKNAPEIHFGHHASKTGPDWLTNDGAVSNLTVYLQITIPEEKLPLLDATKVVTVTFAETSGTEVNPLYATLPSKEPMNIKLQQFTAGVCEIPFTFKWGSVLGEQCPEEFFKEHEFADAFEHEGVTAKTYGDFAIELLKAVESYNNLTYKVTVATNLASQA